MMIQRLFILSFVACIAGCLPEAGQDPSADAGTTVSGEYALITLSATHPRTSGDPTIGVAADALFMRYSAIPLDDVANALGVWRPTAETDGCSVLPGDQGPANFSATVDLLRAGELHVTGNGEQLSLTPRPIPSYFPQFRGAVYGTEEAGPPTYATGETYALTAAGSDDIGAFSLDIDAPAAVELVAINGRETGSATELEVLPYTDLSIEVFSEASEVFVTIEDVNDPTGPAIECRFERLGTLDVSADDLSAVFGDWLHLTVTARTRTAMPLPPEVGIAGVAQIMFVDRVGLLPLAQ